MSRLATGTLVRAERLDAGSAKVLTGYEMAQSVVIESDGQKILHQWIGRGE